MSSVGASLFQTTSSVSVALFACAAGAANAANAMQPTDSNHFVRIASLPSGCGSAALATAHAHLAPASCHEWVAMESRRALTLPSRGISVSRRDRTRLCIALHVVE